MTIPNISSSKCGVEKERGGRGGKTIRSISKIKRKGGVENRSVERTHKEDQTNIIRSYSCCSSELMI